MAAVTICSDFGAPPPQIKSLTVSIVSTSICYELMGLDAMTLVFWILSFKPAFSLSSFTLIDSRPIPVTAAFGSRTLYWPCWTYINEEEALSNQEDKMITLQWLVSLSPIILIPMGHVQQWPHWQEWRLNNMDLPPPCPTECLSCQLQRPILSPKHGHLVIDLLH